MLHWLRQCVNHSTFSNAIEGIISTDDRIRKIVQEGSAPLNHTEAEIAGYRDALNEIHLHPTDYDFNERDIKRFHSMMMRLADPTSKGDYKTEDNVIAEKMSDGRRIVRFTPTCFKRRLYEKKNF